MQLVEVSICNTYCYNFLGEKQMISWHRGYLVVIGNDMKRIPG